MRYIFDLDGTLLDTHEILRQSYNRAGAPPPTDFYNKRWREWATEDQHELKNAFYALHILTHGVEALPLMETYHALCRSVDEEQGEHVEIWTGASFPAVTALRTVHPKMVIDRGDCGMSIADKVARLEKLGEPVTIFDDSIFACEQFQKVEGVTVCHVRF